MSSRQRHPASPVAQPHEYSEIYRYRDERCTFLAPHLFPSFRDHRSKFGASAVECALRTISGEG